MSLLNGVSSATRHLNVPAPASSAFMLIGSSSAENFYCLNDDPFAKMDDRRKPNILFIGVPLSFLAPAALRVARRLNFFIDFEQTLEKLSILRQKRQTHNRNASFLWFLLVEIIIHNNGKYLYIL